MVLPRELGPEPPLARRIPLVYRLSDGVSAIAVAGPPALQRANGCPWTTVWPSGISTANALLWPLLGTTKPVGMGAEISAEPLAVQRLPPQPPPLCTSSVSGALGSMMMMSWYAMRAEE